MGGTPCRLSTSVRLTSLKLFRPDSKPTTPKHISRIVYLRGCSKSPRTSSKPPTFPPSTCRAKVKKSNHTNPVTLPYPPDPGEHVLEISAAPTTLVERDEHDLSSLVPPKGEMRSSFSWTCPFKSPTSSTLCFGEPTLGKLKHMPKSSSGTNRVSVSNSSLVTKNDVLQ